MKERKPTWWMIALPLVVIAVGFFLLGRSTAPSCPDLEGEVDRAMEQVNNALEALDQAREATAYWRGIADSLDALPSRTNTVYINEVRRDIANAGLDAIVDSLSAAPER